MAYSTDNDTEPLHEGSERIMTYRYEDGRHRKVKEAYITGRWIILKELKEWYA